MPPPMIRMSVVWLVVSWGKEGRADGEDGVEELCVQTGRVAPEVVRKEAEGDIVARLRMLAVELMLDGLESALSVRWLQRTVKRKVIGFERPQRQWLAA
jgi:hypothetical protein